MISKHSSDKIKIISLFAAWAIVARHCICGSQIEKWILDHVLFWPVPWFFCVSGFFFAKTAKKMTVSKFFGKKIQSLLLPYLFWCITGWCICTPSITGFVGEVVGLSASMFPLGNSPLWYVRALLVLSFMGILFFQLDKVITQRYLFIAVFSILMLALCGVAKAFGVGLCGLRGILFFLLGFNIAMFEVVWPCNMDRRVFLTMIGGALLLISLVTVPLLRGNLLANIPSVFFLFAMWLIFDCIEVPRWDEGPGIVACIYFMHDPIIKAIDKILNISALVSQSWLNWYYVFRCITLFWLFVLLCIVIKRGAPRFWFFASGGR